MHEWLGNDRTIGRVLVSAILRRPQTTLPELGLGTSSEIRGDKLRGTIYNHSYTPKFYIHVHTTSCLCACDVDAEWRML